MNPRNKLVASKDVLATVFKCHSTGFGNVGTSVCALSKQTNNAYISNQNSRGVPKNNTHARTRALTMTSPCIHYHHQCHLQVVTMLLSRDADVNHVDSAGATALDFVMKAKNHTMARLLLSAGADPDHHAARTGTHMCDSCAPPPTSFQPSSLALFTPPR